MFLKIKISIFSGMQSMLYRVFSECSGMQSILYKVSHEMWSAFFVLSILPEIWRISFRFWQLWFYLITLKSSKNCRPHLRITRTRKIFWLLFKESYIWKKVFINKLRVWRRHSIRLATVMFHETPCSLPDIS